MNTRIYIAPIRQSPPAEALAAKEMAIESFYECLGGDS